MVSFPLLSVKPTVENFGHIALFDPVHRADFESGALLTRTRTQAVPIKYHVNYPAMPDSDKEILEEWERDSIGFGGVRFEWMNHKNITYVTVLLFPIDYKVHPKSKGDFWIVSFDVAAIYLVEVSPEN